MYNEKEILSILLNSGIISESDIRHLEDMDKKEKVLQIHNDRIWQGKNDRRWFTYVHEDGKRRRVAKKTEQEVFDYLYDFYFAKKKSYPTCTLTDLYDEWLAYKIKTSRTMNTPYRLDADYKKYYLNESVSKKIITTPLLELTVADIKEWAFSLIKKYDMTHKAWMNARSVLKQVYDYLIDKGVTDKNPVPLARIPDGFCRKTKKRKASTQIFYSDEAEDLIAAAIKNAVDSGDVAFLAIPLFFYTGMRIGECLALTFSDFNRDDHILTINKMMAADIERNPDGTWGKRKYEIVDHLKGNGDDREVIVTDDCFAIVDLIRKIQARNRELTYQLFPGVTPSNVQFKLYRLCDSLGITRRSPHKWRKTYISTLLNDGFDADFVREQVGHRELQTTLNCYAYSTTRKEDQINKLKKSLAL